MSVNATSASPFANFVNHEDFRQMARRRLPRVVFDFVDGGTDHETTVAANRAAFEAVTFRARKGVSIVPDLTTRVLGDEIDFPVMVAPCGLARVVHPDGEKGLARAAATLGTGYIVPHAGGTKLEEVRAATQGLLWYQIYKVGGRAVAEGAIRRARAAGYRALVVTLDNPGGKRERDIRNGMGALGAGSLAKSARYVPPLLMKPRWLARFMADGQPIASPNVLKPDGTLITPAEAMRAGSQPGSTFTWEDFDWIREAWGDGPIVAKGIQTAGDAQRAVAAGVAAIVVSNHGGRNFDGEPAALSCLAEVVDAVAGRAEVIFDSGIRRGADIAKALALGARAVLVGRLSMFALSGGELGVTAALTMLEAEFRATLRALGCSDPASLDRSFVRAPDAWLKSPAEPSSLAR